MRASLAIVLLLATATLASAEQRVDRLLHGSESPPAHAAHGVLYCQPPSSSYAVNASTAFESEIADDIPGSLVGQTIGEVTLYVTEWGHSEWVEPLGLVIRFYDSSCPPPLEHVTAFSLSWDGLMTSLQYANPPMRIVYEATAALPVPVTVTAGMSIGAYVVTDWPDEPYAGLTMTDPGDLYGCGESYWDDASHGAPRWTPLSGATGVAADLAYSLAEEGTGIHEVEPASWGRIKGLFR